MNQQHFDYDHLPDYPTIIPPATSDQSDQPEPIDWDTVAEIFPALFSMTCWVTWGMFLLIPSVFGLHHAPLFSAANNTVFTLMGFVLCIATSTAIRAGHGGRAVFFGLGLFLLSFWF